MTHWGRIFRDLDDKPIVGKGDNWFKLQGLSNTITTGIELHLLESKSTMGYYYTDKLRTSGIYTIVDGNGNYYQRYLEPGD